MESSIAKFLSRQPACERLPTTTARRTAVTVRGAVSGGVSLTCGSAARRLIEEQSDGGQNYNKRVFNSFRLQFRFATTRVITAFTS